MSMPSPHVCIQSSMYTAYSVCHIFTRTSTSARTLRAHTHTRAYVGTHARARTHAGRHARTQAVTVLCDDGTKFYNLCRVLAAAQVAQRARVMGARLPCGVLCVPHSCSCSPYGSFSVCMAGKHTYVVLWRCYVYVRRRRRRRR